MKHIHCTLCERRIKDSQPFEVDCYGNPTHKECAREIIRPQVMPKVAVLGEFDWNLFVAQVRKYKRMQAQGDPTLTRGSSLCSQQSTGGQHGASDSLAASASRSK